jgi:hypothetical protein
MIIISPNEMLNSDFYKIKLFFLYVISYENKYC